MRESYPDVAIKCHGLVGIDCGKEMRRFDRNGSDDFGELDRFGNCIDHSGDEILARLKEVIIGCGHLLDNFTTISHKDSVVGSGRLIVAERKGVSSLVVDEIHGANRRSS